MYKLSELHRLRWRLFMRYNRITKSIIKPWWWQNMFATGILMEHLKTTLRDTRVFSSCWREGKVSLDIALKGMNSFILLSFNGSCHHIHHPVIWAATPTFWIPRLNIPFNKSLTTTAVQGGACVYTHLWLEMCVNVVASWPAKAYLVVEKVVSDSSSAACTFVPLHCCQSQTRKTQWMWVNSVAVICTVNGGGEGGANIRLQAANLEAANWRPDVPGLSSPGCGRYKCCSCFSCSSRSASDGHGASSSASCLKGKADCEAARPQVENIKGLNVKKKKKKKGTSLIWVKPSKCSTGLWALQQDAVITSCVTTSHTEVWGCWTGMVCSAWTCSKLTEATGATGELSWSGIYSEH